jgi:hypothetical protein
MHTRLEGAQTFIGLFVCDFLCYFRKNSFGITKNYFFSLAPLLFGDGMGEEVNYMKRITTVHFHLCPLPLFHPVCA